MEKSDLPFANAVWFKQIKAVDAGKKESTFSLKADELSQHLAVLEGKNP